MLLERTLELCREKEYEVDMEFLKSIITVTIHDRKAQCKLAEIFMSADASPKVIATEMLAQICLYEHGSMEHNPDALLSAETLAKLNLPNSEHSERIVNQMVDVTMPADEVSEARMSYYWVYNNDMWPVRIEVKVDEYREVVSARYVKDEEDICPGCAGYGVPCKVYRGTQEQLDESTWVKVDNCTNLLPTKYQLIQKLPSEIAYDLKKAEANDN